MSVQETMRRTAKVAKEYQSYNEHGGFRNFGRVLNTFAMITGAAALFAGGLNMVFQGAQNLFGGRRNHD
jgi:hypothetical protein